MSQGLLLTNPDREGISRLLDGILQDFQPANQQMRPQQRNYPLKNLLIMFKSAGTFNPRLLKKLAREFGFDGNRQVYVTRNQLLDELANPNVSRYSKEDLDEIYDFLKGDKRQLQISDIVQKDNPDMASSKVRKTISKEDLFKILEAQVSNVTK